MPGCSYIVPKNLWQSSSFVHFVSSSRAFLPIFSRLRLTQWSIVMVSRDMSLSDARLFLEAGRELLITPLF
jgi:hypothetical protein